MQPAAEPVASGRGRSLNGCTTCRSRHIKCDERRPICLVCHYSGYVCGGYEARIVFDHEGKPKTATCRRPLYSEVERRAITDHLIASVPRSDADKLLLLLDADCSVGGEAPLPGFLTSRGPFSAFRLEDSSTSACEDELQLGDELVCTVDDVSGSIDDELPGFSAFNQLEGEVDCTWPPDLLGTEALDPQLDVLELGESCSASMPLVNNYGPLPTMDMVPPLYNFNPISDTQRQIPLDAVFLLQHFHKSVIRMLSPPCYEKSPWHINFSPSVRNTLGTLTMDVPASDIHMSIFYSILSISAFTLRRSQQFNGSDWESRGGFFQTKAHEYLKRTLAGISSTEKRSDGKIAKYKDLLMSLLALIGTSIFGNQNRYAEACLFDAERVIRLKGLTKSRKSRKVRLLHHLYSYLRIFHESTRGAFEISGRPSEQFNSSLPGSTIDATYIEARFRFDVSWGKLTHSLSARIKDVEEAEGDLHLVAPGRWVPTLYPECIGIPESFMQLLSLVIRLGNEVDIAKSCPGIATLNLSDFMRWAKDLETCIVDWNPEFGLEWEGAADCSCDTGVLHGIQQLQDLRAALHHALLIYFYRRIHDVSPVVLQDRVFKTLEVVQRACGRLDENSLEAVSHFVWPGFIASCEALDPRDQAKFSTWFDTCADTTGLGTFRSAKEVAQQVWDKRKLDQAEVFSWREILTKRDGVRPFYS